MRKTIFVLATAGALTGTALPALAWDRDDDYDHYRPYREHHWWWRHHHHHDYYDRPHYRRYY